MASVYINSNISAEKIAILSFISPKEVFQGKRDSTFMTFPKNICDYVKLSYVALKLN